MSINFTRTGRLIADTEHPQYLINNFTQSNVLTDWSFGTYTFSDGIVTLTGTSPNISTVTFNVEPDDIICFEFTISLPTPSTAEGGGKGCYIGSKTNQGVYVHSFNHTTMQWLKSTTANNNPYFLNAYNNTDILTQKNFILGSNIDLAYVPFGETTNINYPSKAIQLPDGTTTTNIRTGYNTNTTMVINFSNPKIYKINYVGYYDSNNVDKVKFGKNWANAFEFYQF